MTCSDGHGKESPNACLGKCYLIYLRHFKHFMKLKLGTPGDFLSSAKPKFLSFLKIFKNKIYYINDKKSFPRKSSLQSNKE